jgi:hypothetical protein
MRLGSCRGEPFCADEDLPRLDAHGAELTCSRPGVVGEAAVDCCFAVCIDDQQHANLSFLGSGEGAAKENEELICERIHEGCVLVH